MKFSLTLLFAFSVLVVGAQITLVPYDELGKSGTKSILFEYVDEETGEKVKKEFDIQENNPFNKLGYTQKGEGRYGNRIYELNNSDIGRIKSDFKLNKDFPIDENAYLTSLHIAKISDIYATVTYISVIKNQGDIVEEARSSSFLVLDEKGTRVFGLDNLPHDVFSLVVSENGKYVAFASGEHLEHSTFSSGPMIYIYETEGGSLHFQENTEIRGIGSLHQTITIATYCGSFGLRSIFLDQNTGFIYEMQREGAGNLFMRGYGHFIYKDTLEMTFDDFNRIR